MSNRTRRPKRRTGKLKMLLFTGSFAATLAGTQLLNMKDALQLAAVVSDTDSITVVEPAPNATLIRLPSTSRGTQTLFKQIPQVVQPQFRPVARSRSSS